MDRTEILGRLALAYSPSYVGYLVETRGVSFAPAADFMSLVKLAGGDGILVERLNSVDTSAVNSSFQQDKPVDHLAKCAEQLHNGAEESAEAECRAAIDESPVSPWPLLIAAKLSPSTKFVRDPSKTDQAKSAERDALLARAAVLAPDLAAVHISRLVPDPGVNESPEAQRAYAMDAQQFSLAQSRNFYSLPDFSEIEEDSPSPAAGAPESITIEPQVLHQIELEPEIAAKHTHLSQLYSSARDFDQARSELLEAIRLEPDNATLHIELAALFYDTHDRNSCVSELREAARRVPFGVTEHIALAAGLESIGHTPEAISELEMLVDVHPTNVMASQALIGLYLKNKNRKSAIAELRRSLQVASVGYTNESEFVNARYEDQLRLAELLQEDRQFEAVKEQFQFMIQAKPNNAPLHNQYGQVLVEQHDGDAAVAEFYEAIRIDPGMYGAHNNIGLYLQQKKDFESAIAEFRRALFINPNDLNTEIYLGTALGQKGDLKAAEEQFQDAIQKNPKNPETYVGVAFALMQLKDDSAAISHLKTALELQPDSADAENNLAWVYATSENPKLRNPAEALTLAHRAVETSPLPVPAFLDTLAEAQLLNGKRSEALATETRALALDPDNTELQSRLAHFREAANAPRSSKP